GLCGGRLRAASASASGADERVNESAAHPGRVRDLSIATPAQRDVLAFPDRAPVLDLRAVSNQTPRAMCLVAACPRWCLEFRPVVIAFGLMILAGAWTLWTRSPPFPMVAAFAATSLLGLSYFRMTGYAALGAAALILTCGPLRGRLAAALGQSSWLGAMLAGL